MQFYKIANIFLGGFVGLLIGLPLVSYNKLLPLIFMVLGVLVGKKKGNNQLFFYISLISACILIGIVTKNMVVPNG